MKPLPVTTLIDSVKGKTYSCVSSSSSSSNDDDESDGSEHDMSLTNKPIHDGKGNVEKLTANYDQHKMKDSDTCDICKKRFRYQIARKRHMQSHYDTKNKWLKSLEKYARGDSCNTTLVSEQSFLLKANTFHALGNEKHFKCDVCAESYTDKLLFRSHINSHEKRSLNDDANLKPHVDTNDKKDDKDVSKQKMECIKQFTCDACCKSFTEQKQLNEHQLAHNNQSYQCQVCNKNFQSSQSLNQHKRKVHSGKMFACTECTKIFKSSSSLYRHKKNRHKSS